jgi:hypothetical protein
MLENPDNDSSISHSGKIMETGQSAGKSYAYLLGAYLGDGCVTLQHGAPVFKLNTIDADFAAAVKAAIQDVYGPDVEIKIWKHSVSKSSKPNHSLWCGYFRLCAACFNETRDKGYLPESLEKWDADQKKAFIVGLMDSEGFVAEKTTGKTGRGYYMGFKSCDSWVPELTQLMQSVGLKIGRVSACPPYREHYKTPTRFHIKMQSWVDSGMRFNIKRKQDRVDRWAATEPYSERSRYPRKLTSETTRQTG